MAEHAARGGPGVKVIAVQCVPHALAVYVPPKCAKLLGLAVPKIADGGDSCIVEPQFHPPTDTWDVRQRQHEQRLRHLLGSPDRHAVGLVDLAGDLGEQPVRGEADGAGNLLTDVLPDAFLDPPSQARRVSNPRRVELAGELVDGFDRLDRYFAVN